MTDLLQHGEGSHQEKQPELLKVPKLGPRQLVRQRLRSGLTLGPELGTF